MIERIAPIYPAQLTKEFCHIGFLIGCWRKAESVQQYLNMVVVDRSTELAAPCDVVWEAVKTPEAFRTVTRGLLVTPIDQHRCLYRDRIAIEAGFLTPFVGLYARWFYRTRQRRWRALARRLGNA